MIGHSQSGPYSWWESSSAPSPSPWIGSHPAAGQGASPHAWGMAGANKVLLDSLVALRSDGALIVGRGIPPSWLRGGSPIEVTRFPATDGRRVGLSVSSQGRSVSLQLRGSAPAGPVLFQLPSFVDNIESTTAGRADQATGTVTLSPGTRAVTVVLRHPPGQQDFGVEDPVGVEGLLDRPEGGQLGGRPRQVEPPALGRADAVLGADAPPELGGQPEDNVVDAVVVLGQAGHVDVDVAVAHMAEQPGPGARGQGRHRLGHPLDELGQRPGGRVTSSLWGTPRVLMDSVWASR